MMPFLKNDTRVPVWQEMFNKALQSLKTEDDLRMGDRQAIAKDS